MQSHFQKNTPVGIPPGAHRESLYVGAGQFQIQLAVTLGDSDVTVPVGIVFGEVDAVVRAAALLAVIHDRQQQLCQLALSGFRHHHGRRVSL